LFEYDVVVFITLYLQALLLVGHGLRFVALPLQIPAQDTGLEYPWRGRTSRLRWRCL